MVFFYIQNGRMPEKEAKKINKQQQKKKNTKNTDLLQENILYYVVYNI